MLHCTIRDDPHSVAAARTGYGRQLAPMPRLLRFLRDRSARRDNRVHRALVLVESFYLVRDESPTRTNADVYRPKNRVTVGKGQRVQPLSPTWIEGGAVRPDVTGRGADVRRLAARRRGGHEAATGSGFARNRRAALARRALHGDPSGDGCAEEPWPRRGRCTHAVRRGDERVGIRCRSLMSYRIDGRSALASQRSAGLTERFSAACPCTGTGVERRSQ